MLLCPDIGKVSPGPLGLQPRVSLSRPRSQSPASAASPGLCWWGPATAALTLDIKKKSNQRGWDYNLWNSFLLIMCITGTRQCFLWLIYIKISFIALFLLVYYHQPARLIIILCNMWSQSILVQVRLYLSYWLPHHKDDLSSTQITSSPDVFTGHNSIFRPVVCGPLQSKE